MILMTSKFVRSGAVAALSATTLVLAACGGGNGEASSEGAGELSVLAGFYPLEWAAERVGGDRIAVSSATPPGAEPHDLELTPQDVAAVSEADLVVYLEGFQPALDEAVASEGGDRGWNAGDAANLSLTVEGDHGHEDEGEHAEEEEHAEEAAHAEDEEHGHEEGSVDPHFWLDPTRLADVGDALAERLAEADPDGAETYEQNAADLRAELEELDGEMESGLSDCAVDTLVTSHDAFGYLGERYGFEVVGVAGISPSEEPSPDQLAEIADLVTDRGITTVYTETLVDPAIAETVADEAGAQTAVLDPIEGLTDESAGEDYVAIMRANLDTLREGQSCS
jgi:zinc transport system substrate-binding protein